MELNKEQIKKALECCCGDIVECQKCAYVKNGYNRCKERASQDALALINSQEQRIGAQDMTISELRKRAEKAEHDADRYAQRIEAYRQELAEVRVALAEANKERQELTEENDAWQKQLISTEEKADKAYYELACEVEKLRTENANLHASCTELERKCASLNDENERLRGILLQFTDIVHKWGNKNGYDTSEISLVSILNEANAIKSQIEAETVRKMQERLNAHFDSNCAYFRISHDYIRRDIDQIAKEMLEGEQ